MSTFASFVQHSMQVLTTAIRGKEEKGIQIGKEEVKLSLFVDDMILYIENPKDSTKKLLDLITEFGKTVGYIRNRNQEKIPICHSNEKSKIPWNIPNQGEKDLYSENYRILKKLRKTQINGSIYCVHGLEELTSLKCPYYSKEFIDSTQSLLKY